MFHKACDLSFLDGTQLEVKFQSGEVKQYDMAMLFDKYPQLKALQDRDLFLSGRLMGGYGIVWNDELDIETETIFENGITARKDPISACVLAGNAVLAARASAELSQQDLSKLTGIDQSDISKIERGVANPSISTLARIAEALGKELAFSFEDNSI